jgi:hypothetical protein
MITFFKSFIITLLLAGGSEKSVEICKEVQLIEYSDTSFVEFVYPDKVCKHEVKHDMFYPSLVLEEGAFLQRDSVETSLYYPVDRYRDMKITFRKEGCLEN